MLIFFLLLVMNNQLLPQNLEQIEGNTNYNTNFDYIYGQYDLHPNKSNIFFPCFSFSFHFEFQDNLMTSITSQMENALSDSIFSTANFAFALHSFLQLNTSGLTNVFIIQNSIYQTYIENLFNYSAILEEGNHEFDGLYINDDGQSDQLGLNLFNATNAENESLTVNLYGFSISNITSIDPFYSNLLLFQKMWSNSTLLVPSTFLETYQNFFQQDIETDGISGFGNFFISADDFIDCIWSPKLFDTYQAFYLDFSEDLSSFSQILGSNNLISTYYQNNLPQIQIYSISVRIIQIVFAGVILLLLGLYWKEYFSTIEKEALIARETKVTFIQKFGWFITEIIGNSLVLGLFTFVLFYLLFILKNFGGVFTNTPINSLNSVLITTGLITLVHFIAGSLLKTVYFVNRDRIDGYLIFSNGASVNSKSARNRQTWFFVIIFLSSLGISLYVQFGVKTSGFIYAISLIIIILVFCLVFRWMLKKGIDIFLKFQKKSNHKQQKISSRNILLLRLWKLKVVNETSLALLFLSLIISCFLLPSTFFDINLFSERWYLGGDMKISGTLSSDLLEEPDQLLPNFSNVADTTLVIKCMKFISIAEGNFPLYFLGVDWNDWVRYNKLMDISQQNIFERNPVFTNTSVFYSSGIEEVLGDTWGLNLTDLTIIQDYFDGNEDLNGEEYSGEVGGNLILRGSGKVSRCPLLSSPSLHTNEFFFILPRVVLETSLLSSNYQYSLLVFLKSSHLNQIGEIITSIETNNSELSVDTINWESVSSHMAFNMTNQLWINLLTLLLGGLIAVNSLNQRKIIDPGEKYRQLMIFGWIENPEKRYLSFSLRNLVFLILNLMISIGFIIFLRFIFLRIYSNFFTIRLSRGEKLETLFTFIVVFCYFFFYTLIEYFRIKKIPYHSLYRYPE